jgi:hypothetical protein
MRASLFALVLICAAAVLAQQESAADENENPSFSIVNAHLLVGEDGYPVPGDSIFFSGETVHLSFNIAGYAIGEEDYHVRLSYRLDFEGPSGVRFALPQGGEIIEEVFPQDEKWMPIVRASPPLPPHGESGIYKVILTVFDRLAQDRKIIKEVPIFVKGESVEVSKSLLIRNLSFSRTEDGEPLSEPIYPPGGTVWARFHITGFKVAEDNSFAVESSLEVLSAKDEVMFAFESQGEKGAPFYPRRWLPAKFRLDLDSDLRAGEYVVLVSIHDKLRKNTYQQRHRFQVQ